MITSELKYKNVQCARFTVTDCKNIKCITILVKIILLILVFVDLIYADDHHFIVGKPPQYQLQLVMNCIQVEICINYRILTLVIALLWSFDEVS